MTSYKPDPYLAGPLYGKDPWPIRFFGHGFGAVCFNTLACSIIYSDRQFGTRRYEYNGKYREKPSGAPPFENWRDRWTGRQSVTPHEGKTFRTNVEIEWSSVDGRNHAASIDLDKIFEERLVLHTVSRS